MKMIKPHIVIIDDFVPEEVVKKIEMAGRTCYQSNESKKIKDPSAFVRGIVKRGHTSVLEHFSISFRVVTDRGVTHELVRHRIGCSYSQESQRYCRYGNDVTYISHYYDSYETQLSIFYEENERQYLAMLDAGASPQIAREILANGCKTEIYVTMNLRALINFFELRCAEGAHPHMKEIAIPLLIEMQKRLPEFFENIPYDEKFYKEWLDGKLDPDFITYKKEYELI